jgi:phosphoribosyl 1,2-cyclic phosphodiesterase
VQVTFCGVRGSTPAPGPDFVRYGGNTSCVALARDGEPPSLLLDGGTGLRRLAKLLTAPFEGTILLGHLHWDHTQGLPFFPAADKGRVDVFIPAQGDPTEVLARSVGPPHFPLRPDELRGRWTFTGLDEGEHELGGWSVTSREIPHPGGRTFGYRVSDGTATVTYMSDHCPTDLGPGPDGIGEYHEAAISLARNADLLIHDAQLTAAELPERAFLGHAAAEYAVRLGEKSAATQVALFHHDPDRTDDEIDGIVRSLAAAAVPLFAAAEGRTLDVGASTYNTGPL